jgi:hypothetical protein
MESWDPPFLRDDASGNVDCLATLTANNKKESGALFRRFNNLTWRLLLEQEIRISNLASELSEIDKECNENKLRGMTLSELDGLANQWEAYKTDEDEEEPLSRSPARIAYKRKELIHLIDQGLRAYRKYIVQDATNSCQSQEVAYSFRCKPQPCGIPKWSQQTKRTTTSISQGEMHKVFWNPTTSVGR